MREVKTVDAVGLVLGHDLTKIVPGKFKGRAFKKGHIIRQHDIDELLSMGKDHIYILELKEGELHEDDAAYRLARAIRGNNIMLSEIAEGKVNLHAAEDGLLKVNQEAIIRMNSQPDIAIATLHSNRVVKKADKLAGTRSVPLVVPESHVIAVEEIAKEYDEPIVEILPLKHKKVGVVTTGTEVYEGRIKDSFGPVVERKVNQYGSEVFEQIFVPDELETIQKGILDMIAKGADIVITTGGMSVDPDDRTPGAIKSMGADLVSYGSPVLPGNMILLAYYEGIPIMGLPGCVMYEKTTSFDLLLPRVLADDTITRADIASLGYGGLCLSCPVCTYPHCSFGK